MKLTKLFYKDSEGDSIEVVENILRVEIAFNSDKDWIFLTRVKKNGEQQQILINKNQIGSVIEIDR